jgi:hypothetical protein
VLCLSFEKNGSYNIVQWGLFQDEVFDFVKFFSDFERVAKRSKNVSFAAGKVLLTVNFPVLAPQAKIL